MTGPVRDPFLTGDKAEHREGASELPQLPPVKLKSTTWMETVDTEAEEFDDWDDPLPLEEDGLENDESATGVSTSSIASEQPPAMDNESESNRPKHEHMFPGLCTIIPREDHVLIVVHKGAIGRESRVRRVTYSQLRELCRCFRCVDRSTRQRMRTLGEMRIGLRTEGWFSGDVAAMSARIRGNQPLGCIDIKWDDAWHRVSVKRLIHDLRPLGLSSAILLHHKPRSDWPNVPTLYRGLLEGRGETAAEVTTAKTDYRQLFPGKAVDDAAMNKVLTQVHRFGFSIIGGVPTTLTGNDDCSLRRVAEAIGPIRNTFYGETWDVKSMRESKNVAYTDLNLGLHMDLLYHTEPPRFQLLHCLRNRVHGGESYFVDAFAAASDYQKDHPDKAKLLQQHKLVFEYHNDGHHMENSSYIFPDTLTRLRSVISWSPPFQGARRVRGGPTDEKFLDAVALWETYLAQDARRLEFKMEEGDLVLFDNRRVLHARRAFRNWTNKERQHMGLETQAIEDPQRWLKGCYLDGDTVWDKLVTLSIDAARNGRKKAKAQVAS